MFNDAEDTGTFTVTNSTEINTYNTQSLTWVRSDYHKSVHDVEVTVACDNTELFGNGNIKLKVKLKNMYNIYIITVYFVCYYSRLSR